MENVKDHWENVFSTKQSNEVSWTQAYPHASLNYIKLLQLPLTASIIDVGGGDSNLVVHLLDLGFTDLTVLDISEKALERAKSKMGESASMINWIIDDINDFHPHRRYDFWHDRAVFHFLTDDEHISKYIKLVNNFVEPGGYFFLGTFSEKGPLKCSGLEIKQYSEGSMVGTFIDHFMVVKCFTEDHFTPFNTIQNFQYCGFKKIN